MKIGFLITYFYPRTGGAESNCFYLARELAKKHEVHVFTSGIEGSEEVIENIKVHRCKELFRFKYYFACYPSLASKMLQYSLDILHIHGFGFLQHDIAITIYKEKYPNVKIICTPHGPFMALKKYNIFGNIFKKVYTKYIIKNLKFYDIIIQVNPLQYKWMEKEYGIPKEKIRFAPNGIPDETFKKINENKLKELINKYNLKEKFIISYLGRIQEYKGLEQIIKILFDLIKINQNIIFIAIGKDAGDKARLEKMAKELNVSDNIIFTGEVSEDEKIALLDLSEIFVFPSQWEAFGIAMLEAMARGNAIISSKTEGGAYLIEESKNGFLYDYENLNELREKLIMLIANNKFRGIMQKGNIKKAKGFLWSNVARMLEKIYAEI